LFETARKAATSDVSILITGETGTGKDVLARAIHHWSNRDKQPFVKINCAALPESLIESELFGHVKGAFSGALKNRAGRFEVADGGSLLLDEVGDLPLGTQAKLLRILQEGTYQAVGSDTNSYCDVRIIAATNKNLDELILHDEFREDLYFRLNVVHVHMPPLRERVNDIPQITEQILNRINRRTGRGPWVISPSNMKKLQDYHWPGNIRELVNVLERGQVFANEKGSIPIKLDSHARKTTASYKHDEKWPTFIEQERSFIIESLKRTQGKIYGDDGAASLLDLPPTTLSSKIQRLKIDPKKYRV
jgi:transcriptional regulator with GAF, ATPase, and Fis domain